MTRSGTRHWHDSVPESGTRKNCLLLKCVVKITMSNGETSFLCSLLTSSSYFCMPRQKGLGLQVISSSFHVMISDGCTHQSQYCLFKVVSLVDLWVLWSICAGFIHNLRSVRCHSELPWIAYPSRWYAHNVLEGYCFQPDREKDFNRMRWRV